MNTILKRAIPRWLIPAVDTAARFGFAAKGLVGLTVALIAIRVALGFAAHPAGPRGALRTILHQPLGQALLILTGAGLICYAVWMFFQAVADPGGKGAGLKGVVERLAFAVTGLGYLSLGLAAFRSVFGDAGQPMDPAEFTARVMQHGAGRFVIGAIGLTIIIAGILQMRQGITGRFLRHLRQYRMTGLELRGMSLMGRLGHLALGVTSFLTGSFFLRAALDYDPAGAAGLGETLESLLYRPYGRWLLGCVAAGLALYGTYSLLLSRFHRVLDTTR